MRPANRRQVHCVRHCGSLSNFTRKVGHMQVATRDPSAGPLGVQRLFG